MLLSMDDLPPIIIASPRWRIIQLSGVFLSASVSCGYVTALWMIYLQLLLHPLGSEQYNYREFFISIRELWICYCLWMICLQLLLHPLGSG